MLSLADSPLADPALCPLFVIGRRESSAPLSDTADTPCFGRVYRRSTFSSSSYTNVAKRIIADPRRECLVIIYARLFNPCATWQNYPGKGPIIFVVDRFYIALVTSLHAKQHT